MRISDWSSDVCSSDLDRLLVSARIGAAGDGALALFIVDPQAAGVGIERYRTLDGRGAADISLSGVLVAAGALLGAGGDAGDRKSVVSGKSVSVRVGLGGHRIIKKKNREPNTKEHEPPKLRQQQQSEKLTQQR